jgi:hypothetical protein
MYATATTSAVAEAVNIAGQRKLLMPMYCCPIILVIIVWWGRKVAAEDMMTKTAAISANRNRILRSNAEPLVNQLSILRRLVRC